MADSALAVKLIETSGFTITDAPSLDPITVIFHDWEPGRGRLIVACYNEAWTACWNAMSGKTLVKFISECDADYITRNLLWNIKATKAKEKYVYRIAQAVIQACRQHLEASRG